jgi:CheY-like chemotaxis protein
MPAKQLRVMVVDDQEAVCEVIADTIRHGGFEVVGMARNGVEAIARAADLRPDVVVMDIAMPEMNGVEAMREILTAGTAARVLLVSGEYRSLGLTKDDIYGSGASAFLEKPFNVSELFKLLETWSVEMERAAGQETK